MLEILQFEAFDVPPICAPEDAARRIESLINNTMWGDPAAYPKLCEVIHRLEAQPSFLKAVAAHFAQGGNGTSEIEFQWNEDGSVKEIDYAARTLEGETMERTPIHLH